jgi:hypothetical protein
MDDKKCIKCNQIKQLNEYYLNSNGYYQSKCKVCDFEYRKSKRVNNPTIYKDYNTQYRKNNPNYPENWKKNNPEYKKYAKQYYIENKEYFKQYYKQYQSNKRNSNNIFKLKQNIRNSIIRYLKNPKNNNTEQILGCTFDELKQHIESQWVEDMSWDNWTKEGWHIDHIIPLSSATTEEELYKLNHYTNLQPLWASENQSKGSKI